jgi:hypothetical protein
MRRFPVPVGVLRRPAGPRKHVDAWEPLGEQPRTLVLIVSCVGVPA